MNNAPFQVICTKPELQTHDLQDRLIKNMEYTVMAVDKISFYPKVGYLIKGHELNVFGSEAIYDIRHFEVIQTNYADATSEILEKFPATEGGKVDKILIPERII